MASETVLLAPVLPRDIAHRWGYGKGKKNHHLGLRGGSPKYGTPAYERLVIAIRAKETQR